MVRVEKTLEVSPELVKAAQELVPQLSNSAGPVTEEQLSQIVRSPATVLFCARDEESQQIVGMLTLAWFRIPTGVRAWIEDVVVDRVARGQGAGEALTEAALEEARRVGARTVELTSRPSREAANRLYLRMGFEVRETNLYRIGI